MSRRPIFASIYFTIHLDLFSLFPNYLVYVLLDYQWQPPLQHSTEEKKTAREKFVQIFKEPTAKPFHPPHILISTAKKTHANLLPMLVRCTLAERLKDRCYAKVMKYHNYCKTISFAVLYICGFMLLVYILLLFNLGILILRQKSVFAISFSFFNSSQRNWVNKRHAKFNGFTVKYLFRHIQVLT